MVSIIQDFGFRGSGVAALCENKSKVRPVELNSEMLPHGGNSSADVY